MTISVSAPSSLAADRRKHLNPSRSNKPKTSSKRSGCLGTIMKSTVGTILTKDLMVFRSFSSSPLRVLAAIITVLPLCLICVKSGLLRSVFTSWLTLNFKLPTTTVDFGFAPRFINRWASVLDWAATTFNLLSMPLVISDIREYPFADFSERRALAKTTFTFNLSHALIRLGQSSVSIMINTAGLIWLTNRYMISGKSYGK